MAEMMAHWPSISPILIFEHLRNEPPPTSRKIRLPRQVTPTLESMTILAPGIAFIGVPVSAFMDWLGEADDVVVKQECLGNWSGEFIAVHRALVGFLTFVFLWAL